MPFFFSFFINLFKNNVSIFFVYIPTDSAQTEVEDLSSRCMNASD